jgi:hypothetical protein
MSSPLNYPLLVLAVSLVAQWLASYVGDVLRRRSRGLTAEEREDFDIVRTGTFTLLGLIIAFSFSMAVNRYDQRKNYEAAEANAIGTEYARADLLPAEQADAVRQLLRAYLNERIAFYLAREAREEQLHAATVKLQADLWAAVAQVGARQPTAVTALAVAGMNEVLNSEGYTNASWRNRIPFSAWILMGLMAICSNLLIGYGERRTSAVTILVLPVIISISLFLIADIDSPRGGVIRVLPQNLMSLTSVISDQ